MPHRRPTPRRTRPAAVCEHSKAILDLIEIGLVEARVDAAGEVRLYAVDAL